MCERSLAAKLSIENAADTLIQADTHSADQLKKQAIQFIKSHKVDVSNTAAWKRLIMERVDLVFEAFDLN